MVQLPFLRHSLRKGTLRGLLVFIFIAVGTYANSQELAPNGIGVYSEFNTELYAFRLDLETSTNDANTVLVEGGQKQLAIRILAPAVSNRAWSKFWIQNVSINTSSDQLGLYADPLIDMTESFQGDLVAGDLIQIIRLSNADTQILVNGLDLFEVETDGFFEFLMTSLVGSVPPSIDMKNSLLGNGNLSPQLLTKFDSVTAQNSRLATIESWIPEPEPVPEPEPEPEIVEPEPVIAEVEPEVIEEPIEVAVEQAPEVVEIDTAADTPAPVAVEVAEAEPTPEPEPVVEAAPEPTPEPISVAEIEQPVIEEPAEEPVAEEPATEPVAVEPTQVATAEPTTVVLEEEAPSQGLGITAEMILESQRYTQEVVGAINANISFPARELTLRRSGSNTTAVRINRDGTLHSVEIVTQARFSGFDRATLSAIEATFPVEPLPAAIFEEPYEFILPVSYQLADN